MELWSVFKVSDKWWRDSVGVKIVGWVGVVGRCEVCKEWGNCGGVGLGVSRCGVCKVNEEWGKGK